MRVKVGNQWFSAKPGNPIAVELTDQDKANIANMLPHCTRYGQFDDRDVEASTIDQRRDWMAK